MKPITKRLLIGLSTIILILLMIIFVDINTIFQNLQKISIFGIIFFFIVYTGVFLMRTIRLKIIFQGLNLDSSFVNLFGSYGIGWGINELTPGKIGDLVRMEVIRQKERDISLSKSLCGVGIERVIDLLILFTITSFALFFMYFLNIQGTSGLNLNIYIIISAAILFLGVIFIVFIILKTEWILNIIEKISPKLRKLLEGFLKSFIEGINDFRKNKKKLIEVLALSLPTWFFETFTLIIIFYLTGYPINIFIIIIAQIILFFTKTFPITPGGWVISENIASLFIAIFYPSIPYTIILGLVILDHVIRTLYILIFAICSTLLLNFNIKSIKLNKIKGDDIKIKERTSSVTRGFGLLEQFLSIQRMKKAEKLISEHGKEGKILDIGCGTYPYFLMLINFEEKYGIDQEIKDKKILSHNLTLKNHNICEEINIPFENESFDVITMLAVIEHLDRKQLSQILLNCYQILKKDGILIITTPAHWSDLLLKFMAKLRLVSPEEIDDHKSTFKLKDLSQLIKISKFKQENIQKGYFEFFLNLWICAKK